MNPDLWRSDPLLAVASLLPIAAGAVWLVVAPRTKGGGPPPVVIWLTWIATRVAFAFVVHGLVRHASVDVTAFFLPQARHVLAGDIPYRDFASAYGPLFTPLLAAAVAAFGATGPLVLFLIGDLVAWRALATAEGEQSHAAWLWVALPGVWYLTVRYGQDEALGAAFIALGALAAGRNRPVLAGSVLGAGLVATKPLFALAAVAFFVAARRPLAILAASVLPAALVYGALAALGAPVLQPFALEGAAFGIGPTVWRVPTVLAGFHPGPSAWVPFAALAVVGIVLLRRRRASVPDHAAWQFGAFAAFGPKFMPMYFILWAPLLVLWSAADGSRRRWLALYASVLPLAWYFDSGPLQGGFGPLWQVAAAVFMVAIAMLALWPVVTLCRPPARERSGGAPTNS